MKTSVVGYPRIGSSRELKSATEAYFKGHLSGKELQKTAAALRKRHWEHQYRSGVDLIPSNDFSLYDGLLDTAVLLNIVPERYRQLELDSLAEYFSMARGYQGDKGDVRALPMKKWFNTNYHYIEPEISDETCIRLVGEKPFAEFAQALGDGVATKPVLAGPFTLLKLASFTGRKSACDFVDDVAAAYREIVLRLAAMGAEWIQFDEPALVTDLTVKDRDVLTSLYRPLLERKGGASILLQTYFGDIRDCYEEVTTLDFDGVGLDFVEGAGNLDLVARFGFPAGKKLFAGVVNGKNIWKNDYGRTLSVYERLVLKGVDSIVLGTSCSLLHVPYTLANETQLDDAHRRHFAFAEEKLQELQELEDVLQSDEPRSHPFFIANSRLFAERRSMLDEDRTVGLRVASLRDEDFSRHPSLPERERLQRSVLGLPLLPMTTIGSFPQTQEVKACRALFRKGRIGAGEYDRFLREKIKSCVELQERLGLDVLVHGEFERNDMVEFFGEHLEGFLFMEKAWVQSYGTRCVKPPVIWGDVSRERPMTVEAAAYAQSLTDRPVKGMLTGPVTILNWSFSREDVPRRVSALQLALALRDEVLDLEEAGIRIIQIDEAALREKLPLRRSDRRREYLDWAIPAFRLVHGGVRPETQIHTHMCYSEFNDMIDDINEMDADVISFEASRSNHSVIDAIHACGFLMEVGPGVYDIHSPRIPSAEEICRTLLSFLEKIPADRLWVNPDCGLKTRGEVETEASLKHMAEATRTIRTHLSV